MPKSNRKTGSAHRRDLQIDPKTIATHEMEKEKQRNKKYVHEGKKEKRKDPFSTLPFPTTATDNTAPTP